MELLFASKQIVDPKIIESSTTLLQENWYLLLTNYCHYWAKITPESGIPSRVSIYNAITGAFINDSQLLDKLKSTDTTLRDSIGPQYLNTQHLETPQLKH